MAKDYDASIKHLIEAHPKDWLAFAKLPPGDAVELVDSDVSSVTAAADKVLRVTGPTPYIAHFEFQSGADADFDKRMLRYNVLLRMRHNMSVRTAAILLRPAADYRITGGVVERNDFDAMLEFRYRVIHVWEQSPESLLSGGVGVLPLAPISKVNEAEVTSILGRVTQRLVEEADASEQPEMLAATMILLGLRYSRPFIDGLIAGVRTMNESVTYQIIIERGEAIGIRKVLLMLGSERFGPPSPDIRARLEGLEDAGLLNEMVRRVNKAVDWEDVLDSPS